MHVDIGADESSTCISIHQPERPAPLSCSCRQRRATQSQCRQGPAEVLSASKHTHARTTMRDNISNAKAQTVIPSGGVNTNASHHTAGVGCAVGNVLEVLACLVPVTAACARDMQAPQCLKHAVVCSVCSRAGSICQGVKRQTSSCMRLSGA